MFENSRDICIENYKLDPGWYYTLPGLAWDAMLKRTGVTLELLTNVDMLLMFNKNLAQWRRNQLKSGTAQQRAPPLPSPPSSLPLSSSFPPPSSPLPSPSPLPFLPVPLEVGPLKSS